MTVIDAENNWWGVTDSAAIEALVYHQVDDPESPLIDYMPFSDGSFEFHDTVGCCNGDGIRGNADGITGTGGEIDVADLSYMVDYLFKGGPPPPCTEEGNVDAIIGIGGPIDVADLSYLVDYLFKGGAAPPVCP